MNVNQGSKEVTGNVLFWLWSKTWIPCLGKDLWFGNIRKLVYKQTSENALFDKKKKKTPHEYMPCHSMILIFKFIDKVQM